MYSSDMALLPPDDGRVPILARKDVDRDRPLAFEIPEWPRDKVPVEAGMVAVDEFRDI